MEKMKFDSRSSVTSDLSGFSFTMADDQLADEKTKYQQRLFQMCRGKPLNVVIIGEPGAGKSSFINTIGAALSRDRWREYACYGNYGDANQMTVFSKSFPKCCQGDNEDFEDINLPTLIDVPGVSRDCKEHFTELLRILFYGRLPVGESLAEANQYYEEHGLQGLKKKYSQNNEEHKVDRIVVVSAATTYPQSSELIRCVINAARPGGRDGGHRRTIPIFGVMTKQDKIGSDELTEADYQKREKEFVQALGLQGSMHRFLRCRNYCDDVDEGRRTEGVLPELDVPVLKFLCQLADPVIGVENEAESYKISQDKPGPRRRRSNQEELEGNHDNVQHLINQPSEMVFLLTLLAEVVIVWIVLMMAVTSDDPEMSYKIRGVCRYIQKHHAINEQSQQDFIQHCNSVQNPWSKSMIIFLIIFLFLIVRVGVKYVPQILRTHEQYIRTLMRKIFNYRNNRNE